MPEEKPEIKFGLDQFKNPMPAKTTRNFGIAAFVLTNLSGYIGTAPYIAADISSSLQGLLSFMAGICLGLIPFFGVETTQKKVDIENVAAIETEKP